MRSKKEILAAVARTTEMIKQCKPKAIPNYASGLVGNLVALLFVLGYSQKENYAEREKIMSQSPYWISKRKKLKLKFNL